MPASQSSKAALAARLPRIIYVEGQDDAFFIDRLLTEIGADRTQVGIVHLNGDGAFAKEIDLLLKSAAYVQKSVTHLAFFFDADASAEGRLASINSELNKRGLPTLSHGALTSYDAGQRQAAIFLFPNGTDAGELEDLLLATVANDNRLPILQEALEKIEQEHGELNKRSKRIARMYMSVVPIKPCGVGRGYREGVFQGDHASVEAVKSFLVSFTT